MPGFAQALDKAIDRLTAEFTFIAEDGIFLGEFFTFLFSACGELAALGKQYMDTPDAKKRRLILSSIQRLVKKHVVDIPGVPTVLEPLLFMCFLQFALPAAYDWIAGHTDAKGHLAGTTAQASASDTDEAA